MKIIINKNSKHFRFYKWLSYRIDQDFFKAPTNLCSYFWSYIRYLAIGSFFSILLLLGISLILSPIALLWIDLNPFIKAGLAVDAFISLFFGVVFFILTIQDKEFYNISKEFIKTKKSKVCPILEYKDETK